eukprot:scaffold33091_cov61-Phaeocystis_antarctica.AAC.6
MAGSWVECGGSCCCTTRQCCPASRYSHRLCTAGQRSAGAGDGCLARRPGCLAARVRHLHRAPRWSPWGRPGRRRTHHKRRSRWRRCLGTVGAAAATAAA